jgi:hypothetical protein
MAIFLCSCALVLFCAQADWERAEEQVRVFLAVSPTASQIRETLRDLADLRETLLVDANRLGAVRHQLDQAVGGPGQPPTPPVPAPAPVSRGPPAVCVDVVELTARPS